jgi:chromate reductase, NAD(P)H dehydrogenase (quinone)
MIKIATVSGSAQKNNNTENALALVHDELSKMAEVEVIDIRPKNLKLAIPGIDMDGSDRSKLQALLKEADGVILATPEYHGSFSSLLKLTIENMGFPSAIKGKPVGLLGVAGGSIGAVKSLEHLRSVCAHVGALVLPGSISIANVRSVFDEDGNCLDAKAEKSIRKVATRIIRYIEDTSCPKRSFEEMIRD